jgi:glycosyltransferase involved in cell wall biosynthesis
MKVKLVSLDNRGFHDKLYRKTKESIEKAGHEITETNPDLLHIVRVTDIRASLPFALTAPSTSFLMMGAAQLFRDGEQKDAFLRALESPRIRRIIIMSIHPQSLRDALGVDSPKLVITDEPPYETPEFYRSLSREEARTRLNIPSDTKMALYFGTYFYSKGADLLLEAAKDAHDVMFYMVGDTKLTSFDYDIKEKYQLPNVVWIDGYVSEETARDYFRACDVVVLPYRHFYEHDTSGVFNQAMLAERLVILPFFDPFKAVWAKSSEHLAMAFYPEEDGHLEHVIRTYFEDAGELWGIPNGFDSYLSAQKRWESIGEAI